MSDFDDFEQGSTTRVPAPVTGLRLPSVDLVVVEGKDRGKRVTVQASLSRIGTAGNCDLVLTDPTVSRMHCELRVRAGTMTVKDHGSTNGTYVGGARIRDADVPAGTVLRVGATSIRVDVGDAPSFVEVSPRTSFGELVGASLPMRQLYAVLERVAPMDTTLLVTGETGTGKDVVARSVHAMSRRNAGSYVPIDCGAIPEALFESELFGHMRGAFSGATSDRRGVFEEADGGTLFLDEIGEMPLALQAKLLRAIETRTVRRVGGNTAKRVDVRIVAATNRDLARRVNEGTFREDLYYRLAVVEVSLPSLRERPEDVPLLAQHFYDKLSPGAGPLPQDFLRLLASRSFPGNVRELRNFIERSVSLGFVSPHGPPSAPSPSVERPHAELDDLVPLHLPLKDARQAWTERFEEVYLRAMLKKTGGNVTRAAELAGVSRRFLQRLAARLGIRASDEGA
ncbi:sigma 54-interacting transcriptional regulator [Polyangium jinanense]|uniref:sigma 54-interacting transcriptional regulator n=1 Tax=Polyangium jinanense TaxID=2829994 RepID=UPI00234114B2|nr:sigma 54-interacting transcriptional regulator [Polyangium jinanense]MDC3954314.1 sigma 54-interacting transcriptional regulator [Polyangium jinanense]